MLIKTIFCGIFDTGFCHKFLDNIQIILCRKFPYCCKYTGYVISLENY